jgi:alpha-N-arabinofuranosidase
MKQKDPSITVLACGGDGGNLDQEWNKIVLTEGMEAIDALTLHFYAPLINSSTIDNKELYQAVVAAPVKQEKVLQLTAHTMEEVGYKVPIAVTEWNCNYGEQDKSGREQTMEALVSNAGLLNVFLRNSNSLIMCNASDLVNGWAGGIIRSSRGEAYGTATYHLIKMYAEAKPEVVLECEYECDTYDVSALGNIDALVNVPLIDIVCCRNVQKEIVVFAINRHYSESVMLGIPGSRIKRVQRIWNKDILAKNSFENPDLITAEDVIYNSESVELLPHSSYAIKLNL